MTGSTMTDDVLEDLPPSAKLVYKVLEEDEPRTQQEIRDESWLCDRTTRYAVDRLEAAGLITSRPNPSDARQELYQRTG
ncbi:MarR family transcriptional regulator [Haloarcula rubra]